MDTSFLTKLIDELVEAKVENALLKQKTIPVNSEIKCTKDMLDETVELKMKIKELEKELDNKTAKIVTLDEKCKQYREHIEQYASSYLNINIDEMMETVEDGVEDDSVHTDDEKETVVSTLSTSKSVKNIIVNTDDSTSKDRKAYMREYMREKRKKDKK
jgi:hypothetical protein